jgi:methylated-DNA-[protein]-cysteine S-methyltransferase
VEEDVMAEHYWAVVDSPIGGLVVAGDGRAVTGVGFVDRQAGRGVAVEPGWVRDATPLAPAIDQLAAYFAGEQRRFDLVLRPAGTPFQRRVWAAVAAVPYGTTASYSDLAARLGRPGSARAVGAANGSNPLAIVIPCHRIVGSDGGLTGYGGGLDAKRFLLALERGTDRPAGPPLVA